MKQRPPRVGELSPLILDSCADHAMLEMALRHSSYVNETPDHRESNERLEYLGDAVLGLAVGASLFRRHPTAAEGQLTQARAALVRTDCLAAVAQRNGVSEALGLGASVMKAGASRRALAGALEAILGAVYVSCGHAAADRLALMLLESELHAVRIGGGSGDPKSELTALVQAAAKRSPSYRLERVGGTDHLPLFRAQVLLDDVVLGEGDGESHQQAEQAAAAAALASGRAGSGVLSRGSPPA